MIHESSFKEASPGFEPGMVDLQSTALATWPRRHNFCQQATYQLSNSKDQLNWVNRPHAKSKDFLLARRLDPKNRTTGMIVSSAE